MKQPCSLLMRFFFPFLFILATSSPAKADLTYVVKRGDSLSSIAKKFHLSVEEIQEANELSDVKIRTGQRLTIPEQGSKAGTATKGKKVAQQESGADEFLEWDLPDTHTVKKGETLAKIAYRYHLWVEDLEEINQLRGKKLKPGQIIYLQPPLKAKQEEIEGDGKEKREEKKEVSDEVAKGVLKRNEFLAEEKDQQLLVRVAKAFLGLKYSRGGTNINGMDCSAFVQKVFRIFDIDLPRTTREQFLVGYTVAQEALRIGDLVFFKRGQARRPGHVGIYIGNGQFIHTSLRKQRVEVNSFENRYFLTRFIGAKRIEEVKERLEAEEISRN